MPRSRVIGPKRKIHFKISAKLWEVADGVDFSLLSNKSDLLGEDLADGLKGCINRRTVGWLH